METVDTFSVKIFLIKEAIAFLRSTFVSPKLFEHRILLHLSASIAEGPDPPFVLMAAFFIISSSIPANMIVWTSCGTPVSKTLLRFFFRCFSFNLFSVSLLSGGIPCCMLLVSNFAAALILPFFIYIFLHIYYLSSHIFFDNSAIVFIGLLLLKDFCIVSPSMRNFVSSPSFHKFNLLFKASKMYYFPDLPDESKKIFFLQKTTLS